MMTAHTRARSHRLVVALAVLSLIALRAHTHAAQAVCEGPRLPATLSAEAALEKDPASLETRFRLTDALISQGCYDEAVHVLEAGEALHPRSNELQARLRTTRSLVGEEQYFEGLERAEESAKRKRALLRCEKLADLTSCDAALRANPRDPEAALARAGALLELGRYGDAVAAYQSAKTLAPADDTISTRLADAEAKRTAAVKVCESSDGDSALQACRAASLRGSADEFALHKREAILLQSLNEPSKALDAYIAAAALKADDRAVSLAIVSLTGSTERKDAVSLAARGRALLELGRASEAVMPLRQAAALSPGLPDLKAQLASAEKLAASTEARSASQERAALREAASAPAAAKPRATRAPRVYSNAAPPSQTH